MTTTAFHISINAHSRFLVEIYEDNYVHMTVEDMCGCVHPEYTPEQRGWYTPEPGKVCRYCSGREWTSSQDEGTMASLTAIPGIVEVLLGIMDAKGIPHDFRAGAGVREREVKISPALQAALTLNRPLPTGR